MTPTKEQLALRAAREAAYQTASAAVSWMYAEQRDFDRIAAERRRIANLPKVEAAIRHPAYSHSRMGTGCLRNHVHIYHRNPKSPTGVTCAATGEAADVDPMLRAIRNNSPLSPTER